MKNKILITLSNDGRLESIRTNNWETEIVVTHYDDRDEAWAKKYEPDSVFDNYTDCFDANEKDMIFRIEEVISHETE